MSLLTAVPPGVVLLAVAIAVAVLPRRAGHALGIVAALGLLAWSLVVPDGTYLATEFLGFDAVLLYVDEFSRLMGMIFGIIAAAAVLYSYASDASSRQTGIALSYVATSTGAVFAGDWLTLVFFWELMAITSTLLVWHYGGPAVRAGFRYAIAHGIGGTLLMGAVLWHYAAVESFLFTASDGLVAGIPAAMAAVGIGVNVGFVGLHVWLPDTYPRPHFAASVFLCVFTTKTGVYGMYRAFPDGHLWIAYMGGAMAVFGAFYALFQDDMRRLLSYHIQSQVGYMIAGVGIGTALATAGAFGHVFNHILYKALLFMTAGVVIHRTGQEKLSDLGGLARKMPITAIAFTIAALSIAGFPGFNGFVSKGMVTAEAHYEMETLFWLLMIGGVGTFMSFIKFGYYAFFHGEYDGLVSDANRGQTVAMLSIAGLCVFYGLFPDALFAILPLEGSFEAHPYTLSHIGEVLVLAATAIVGFFAVKKFLKRAGELPDLEAIYAPVTFYGTRYLVVGATELYAAVDRAAVALADGSIRAARNPEAIVSSIPFLRLSISRRDEDVDYPMRAGIGLSVLVLVVVVSVTLVLLAVS